MNIKIFILTSDVYSWGHRRADLKYICRNLNFIYSFSIREAYHNERWRENSLSDIIDGVFFKMDNG